MDNLQSLIPVIQTISNVAQEEKVTLDDVQTLAKGDFDIMKITKFINFLKKVFEEEEVKSFIESQNKSKQPIMYFTSEDS